MPPWIQGKAEGRLVCAHWSLRSHCRGSLEPPSWVPGPAYGPLWKTKRMEGSNCGAAVREAAGIWSGICQVGSVSPELRLGDRTGEPSGPACVWEAREDR